MNRPCRDCATQSEIDDIMELVDRRHQRHECTVAHVVRCDACGARGTWAAVMNIGTVPDPDPILACGSCAALPGAVSVLVRMGRDRYLAVSRPGGPPLEWGLPGGKREPGETFPDAAERELHEETSLRAQRLRRVHVAPCPGATTYLNVVFEAEVEPGWPVAEAGLQVAWLTRTDVETGPFGAYNRAMEIVLY